MLRTYVGPMSAHVDHNRFESGIWELEDIDDQNEGDGSSYMICVDICIIE